MKRVLLIISLHLFLFLIVFAYQAQAEEEGWSIHDFKEFTYLIKFIISLEVAFFLFIHSLFELNDRLC